LIHEKETTKSPSAFDIKHNFVVSYNYELPFPNLLGKENRMTDGWELSGITRFATGLPVTFASFGDNALVYVQNNGVNSVSVSLFTPNALGTQSGASSPGRASTISTSFSIKSRNLLRPSRSNSVWKPSTRSTTCSSIRVVRGGGNIGSPTFGHMLKAAPPHIGTKKGSIQTFADQFVPYWKNTKDSVNTAAERNRLLQFPARGIHDEPRWCGPAVEERT
jgi:hypothetical protein